MDLQVLNLILSHIRHLRVSYNCGLKLFSVVSMRLITCVSDICDLLNCVIIAQKSLTWTLSMLSAKIVPKELKHGFFCLRMFLKFLDICVYNWLRVETFYKRTVSFSSFRSNLIFSLNLYLKGHSI